MIDVNKFIYTEQLYHRVHGRQYNTQRLRDIPLRPYKNDNILPKKLKYLSICNMSISSWY